MAASLTLVVLAPVLVAAGNYLLIGRLIRAVLPPSTGHRVFGLPARLLTRVFVSSDVLTFFVQAAGSGVASSVEWVGPTADVGVKILIGGLALQAVMFIFFLSIFSRFVYLAKRKGLAVGDAPRGWEKVVVAVYVSSAMILVCSLLVAWVLGWDGTDGVGRWQVRCIYRVGEFTEGTEGYAFLHEWMFWVFESLPMLVAIGIFAVYHPSKYLGHDGGKSRIRIKGMEGGDSEEAAAELRPRHGRDRSGN